MISSAQKETCSYIHQDWKCADVLFISDLYILDFKFSSHIDNWYELVHDL